MKKVYIHIPFCSTICSYCDFAKTLKNNKFIKEYLEKLEQEIKDNYEGEIVDSIYIGGGTPSCLELDDLKRLFEIVKIFNLSKFYEFTFEMNVNDITTDLLELLDLNKVNRISVGVESFNKENLKFLNRNHNKKMIINNIKLLKQYFDNINVDLIYAIPNETMDTLNKDIKNILRLEINHISTYSLIIENNTKLKINNIKNINEDMDSKMYFNIIKKLKKHGFNHYEVSNFSLPGNESIHNINYWENKEYYGFGLGSHGYINGIRYERTRSLSKYLIGDYRLSEYFLSKKEIMENEIMLGLRLLKGINIEDFFNKYKVNIQDEFNIVELLKNKFLIIENKYLKIPENKIYIMNEILNKILE